MSRYVGVWASFPERERAPKGRKGLSWMIGESRAVKMEDPEDPNKV